MIRLHLLFEPTHLILDVVDMLKSGQRRRMHRLAAGKIDVLFEQAKIEAAHLHDIAGVGGLSPDQEVEERRLPGSVPPDEADLLARIHLERNVAKDRVTAVRF